MAQPAREVKEIMWKAPFCIALFALWLFDGCSLLQEHSEVEFRRDLQLTPEFPYAARSAQTAVFRTEQQWKDFYEANTIMSDSQGKPTVPPAPVDFESRMMVVVFYGQMSGCGGSAEVIKHIERRGGKLVVSVDELPPQGPCLAVIYPYDMVDLEKIDAPVRFVGALPK